MTEDGEASQIWRRVFFHEPKGREFIFRACPRRYSITNACHAWGAGKPASVSRLLPQCAEVRGKAKSNAIEVCAALIEARSVLALNPYFLGRRERRAGGWVRGDKIQPREDV